MSSLASCLLTLRLHLNDCDFDSRLLFLVSLLLSLYIYTDIVTIIVYYISLYWQNLRRPEFLLKRLLVPVTQSWHFTDIIHEPVCITSSFVEGPQSAQGFFFFGFGIHKLARHITSWWRNRTLISHERDDSRFLVLPGSESIFTEVTEYVYFIVLRLSQD